MATKRIGVLKTIHSVVLGATGWVFAAVRTGRGPEPQPRKHTMASATLRSADLVAMSPEERDKAIAELWASALGPNPEIEREIRDRIRAFEVRYEITSDEMRSELYSGKRKETADIAEWLFWLNCRESRVAG